MSYFYNNTYYFFVNHNTFFINNNVNRTIREHCKYHVTKIKIGSYNNVNDDNNNDRGRECGLDLYRLRGCTERFGA